MEAIEAIEGFATIEAMDAIEAAVEYEVGGIDIDIDAAALVVAATEDAAAVRDGEDFKFEIRVVVATSGRRTCTGAEGAQECAERVAVDAVRLALVLPHHRAHRDGRLRQGGERCRRRRRARRDRGVPRTRFAADGGSNAVEGSTTLRVLYVQEQDMGNSGISFAPHCRHFAQHSILVPGFGVRVGGPRGQAALSDVRPRERRHWSYLD